ncbi:hypothetical protein TREMEDRAFT_22144, partial [Tremella mesenterica DSM 1558]|uniref:uncharacterized protein n=1 Tax=Tremella mesenterica (strain ATCC 24925 / CBS 8224 / DSM 1558 / NBRC 9311 / NRRL Y-6157 / RJB 2259-6 / UBC 559-6) TaxID=578456 RepID=UPI0003F49AB5
PVPPSKPIPTDFRSSLSAWWSNSSYREARYAEERLLRRMAMYRPSPNLPVHKGWKHKDDTLVDYINTLEISKPEDANAKEAVVVLHGYAAALGFFFRNWEPISQAGSATSRRTFFLDWLGMGLSSRPSPDLLSSPSTASVPSRVARAEHFFLSSLEEWRQSMGLDRIILVGHSLGGYLASAYTVRYPERVRSLILVSPAGIPRGPEWKHFPTSGQTSEADMTDMAQHGEPPVAEEEHVPEPKGEARQWNQNPSMFARGARRFFIWGWDKGLSPFSILRALGPWAPMTVGRYSSRRFVGQSEEDIRDLHAYIYNTSILKGSGEYCISHILAPGAHARIPIVDRISKVTCPVTFIYGDNDWMDVDGGHESVKVLNKAGNKQATVHVVPKAGHHVYLDNSEVTNRII